MSHTCPVVAGYCLSIAGWLIGAPQASPSAQSCLVVVLLTLLTGYCDVLGTLMNPTEKLSRKDFG